MAEEFDLNKLRKEVLDEKKTSAVPEVTSEDVAINTRERFDALPHEEQIRRMEQKGYTDLALFRDRYYAAGVPDINKLRSQVQNVENDKSE